MTRQQLIDNIRRKQSFLCVGLDPDQSKMPARLAGRGAEGLFEFNRAIIDATAEYAVAYKPNLAFYEALGAPGQKALEDTCRHIRAAHPDILIIADAKRGDIGNTARMYARSLFEGLGADAATVAPYMGRDSVSPFLEYADKWTIVLALTSNPGSADFQMLPVDADGTRLFEAVVAEARKWASADNLMFVVGATRGSLIADVRRHAPDNFLLVPGIGAQGGSLEEVCSHGLTDDIGLLVNSSRGIIHASSDAADFERCAAEAARAVQQQMQRILQARHIL